MSLLKETRECIGVFQLLRCCMLACFPVIFRNPYPLVNYITHLSSMLLHHVLDIKQDLNQVQSKQYYQPY